MNIERAIIFFAVCFAGTRTEVCNKSSDYYKVIPKNLVCRDKGQSLEWIYIQCCNFLGFCGLQGQGVEIY